jgi:peroxidase
LVVSLPLQFFGLITKRSNDPPIDLALYRLPLPGSSKQGATMTQLKSTQDRTADGSGNNLSDPKLNAVDTDFARIGPANFADGFDSMQPGPNPREISNIVVAGGPEDGALQVNGQELSGMMYAWGQFIDHDLDLEQTNPPGSDISISVPKGDSLPSGTTIPLTRVTMDPATGKPGHPATAVNTVTGWLDASMVYGSDAATASSLRLPDGHLKTSAGDNLPIVSTAQGPAFAAGDVRAQENPDLTALQTLFVREHNYQVDQLKKQHPSWTGDQLYQQAKAITTAEIANITYNEFLPHLLGQNSLPAYKGYDPNVNPTITEEFEGAAYRFGHSIVSDTIDSVSNGGATTSSQLLKDVFFESPSAFTAAGGANGLLRHLADDTANPLDTHIVDDLRNFLSDPPDLTDLAAINIQRGRDLGLGTLNETRIALGLAPYTSFKQISNDPKTVAALQKAYGSVDKVDLWTGGLAENHSPGAAIGPTFGTITAHQFTALRVGDRLYFENQGFDSKTLAMIKQTTLSDIIARDTDTDYIQKDAFAYYDRRTGLLGGVASENPTAPQLIIGSDGNDTLIGGPNSDILVAGKGHQTLTGGAGSDTFDLSKQGTNAVITDFNVDQDKLEIAFPFLQNGKPWHISSDHGNTLIQGNDFSVLLKDVAPSQLSAADFVLPGQSQLVSNHALLAQFAAAGFQSTGTNAKGPSNAPSAASENPSFMIDSILAPSNGHAHG